MLNVPLAGLHSDVIPRASHAAIMATPAERKSLQDILDETERTEILRALEASNGIIAGPSGAAVRLGIKRSTLQLRMKKLGIRLSRTPSLSADEQLNKPMLRPSEGARRSAYIPAGRQACGTPLCSSEQRARWGNCPSTNTIQETHPPEPAAARDAKQMRGHPKGRWIVNSARMASGAVQPTAPSVTLQEEAVEKFGSSQAVRNGLRHDAIAAASSPGSGSFTMR
jgi:hypothetical protein